MAAPPLTATIRRTPADFLVEELPAYPPSGEGEHLFVTFRKTDLTTADAVRAMARALEVDPRGAGFAGRKDRHAVTTQVASFPFAIGRDVESARRLTIPGIEVLDAARHRHKLKPGHLAGNRFVITLRDVSDPESLAARLGELARDGVPNAFGGQRFGRDGANPERALAWLGGRTRGPRDRSEQRLIFSALQSLLFNQVLDRRVAAGTWGAALPGDVVKKHDTGGLFTVPAEGPELDDARARAASGALSATGPMFGAKMRWPEGEPAALEREVLVAAVGEGYEERLEAFRHVGEGTRRPLRMWVRELSVELEPAGPDGQRKGVVARFVLPKGGYATTVLGQICALTEPSRGPAGAADEDEGSSSEVEETADRDR